MKTLNWRYGAKTPTKNLEIVTEQLLLASRYRNTLCRLEHNRRDAAYKAAAKANPEFSEALEAYKAAQAAVDEHYAALRLMRQKARRRIEPPAEWVAEADKLRASRNKASEKLSDTKAAAFRMLKERQQPYLEEATQLVDQEIDKSGKEVKPITRKRQITARYHQLLEAAGWDDGGGEHSEAVKQARADSGLYWGTYLTVEDACKTFAKGAPPKFKPFSGNGSVAVQIQGGATIEDLTNGKNTLVQLELPKITKRMARRGKDGGRQLLALLRLRVGSDGRKPIWAEIPFTYGREFPKDTVIKWAYIDRRRVGIDDYWYVRFIVQTKQQLRPEGESGTVAVHLGYRSTSEGTRVAMSLDDRGNRRMVCIPDSELESLKKRDSLEGFRDQTMDMVVRELQPWIASQGSDWLREQCEYLHMWKDPTRLARLVLDWAENRFPGDLATTEDTMPKTRVWAIERHARYLKNPRYKPGGEPDNLDTVFGLMQAWRRYDDHMVRWSSQISHKVILRRRNLFGKFAADLRRDYKHLILADVDWSKLSRKAADDEEVTITTSLRRIRSLASPGELTQNLKEVFAGDLTAVSAVNISLECHKCGHVLPKSDQTRRQCVACGANWDQDDNAVQITLNRGLSKMHGEQPTAKAV